MNKVFLLAAAALAISLSLAGCDKPATDLAGQVREAVIRRDRLACGVATLPDAAFTPFRSGPEGPAVLVDYRKARCLFHPGKYAGRNGAPLELWTQGPGGADRRFRAVVLDWRLRGFVVTDQASRGAARLRVVYGWDGEQKTLLPDPALPAAFTLAQEEGEAAGPLGQAVRAAVIKENDDCEQMVLPAWAVAPVGDLTGDGRPEMAFDLGTIQCRGEAARGFSTGGDWREVWTDHGGRLRRIFADNVNSLHVAGGRLVTSEHPIRCEGLGTDCEGTYAYDAKKDALVAVSKVMKAGD